MGLPVFFTLASVLTTLASGTVYETVTIDGPLTKPTNFSTSIQSTVDYEDAYVYLILKNGAICYEPIVTITTLDTDYNGGSEYFDIYLNGTNVMRCNPGEQSCSVMHKCVDNVHLKNYLPQHNWLQSSIVLYFETHGNNLLSGCQYAFYTKVLLSCQTHTSQPTPATHEPTQSPSLAPTPSPTSMRSVTVDLSSVQSYPTSVTTSITTTQREEDAYIYFNMANSQSICYQPKISIVTLDTDYNSAYEYLDIHINDQFAMKCDPDNDSCRAWFQCVDQLSVASFFTNGWIDITQPLKIYMVPYENDLLGECHYSSFTNVTLYCEDHTSAPTSVTEIPTRIPTAAPTPTPVSQAVAYVDMTTDPTSDSVSVDTQVYSSVNEEEGFVYFYMLNNSICYEPKITISILDTDFNSNSEYVEIYFNDAFGESCNPDSDSCNQWFDCMSLQRLTPYLTIDDIESQLLVHFIPHKNNRLGHCQWAFLANVTLVCNKHTTAPTSATLPPTPHPTVVPTQPTPAPVTSGSAYVDVSTLGLGEESSATITISTEEAHEESWAHFLIRNNGTCFSPHLSVITLDTDFDSSIEYFEAFINNQMVFHCDPGTDTCSKYYTCSDHLSLDSYLTNGIVENELIIDFVASNNNELSNCQHSFYTNVTLHCQRYSVAPTAVTLQPTARPSMSPTPAPVTEVIETIDLSGVTSYPYAITTSIASDLGREPATVYFQMARGSICYQPKLSVIALDTDYNSASEYIEIWVNDKYWSTCSPNDDSCAMWYTCLDASDEVQLYLNDNWIDYNTSLKIEFLPHNNDLLNQCQYAFFNNVTLHCEDTTPDPTMPPLQPTAYPSYEPTPPTPAPTTIVSTEIVLDSVANAPRQNMTASVYTVDDARDSTVYFTIRSANDDQQSCFDPKLSVIALDTDFNVESEYFEIFVNNERVSKCDPSTDTCSKWYTCLEEFSIASYIDKGYLETDSQLTVYFDVYNNEANTCEYSFFANVTLSCSLFTAAPTPSPINSVLSYVEFSSNTTHINTTAHITTRDYTENSYVYFELTPGSICFQPHLTVYALDTDYDGNWEFFNIFLNDDFWVRCDPKSKACKHWFECERNVDISKYVGDEIDETLLVWFEPMNTFPPICDIAFAANVTLTCGRTTATPTEITAAPVLRPTAEPISLQPTMSPTTEYIDKTITVTPLDSDQSSATRRGFSQTISTPASAMDESIGVRFTLSGESLNCYNPQLTVTLIDTFFPNIDEFVKIYANNQLVHTCFPESATCASLIKCVNDDPLTDIVSDAYFDDSLTVVLQPNFGTTDEIVDCDYAIFSYVTVTCQTTANPDDDDETDDGSDTAKSNGGSLLSSQMFLIIAISFVVVFVCCIVGCVRYRRRIKSASQQIEQVAAYDETEDKDDDENSVNEGGAAAAAQRKRNGRGYVGMTDAVL